MADLALTEQLTEKPHFVKVSKSAVTPKLWQKREREEALWLAHHYLHGDKKPHFSSEFIKEDQKWKDLLN